MRLAITALALCTLALPAQAREKIVFMTELFSTDELGSWFESSSAKSLAKDRRDLKASSICQAMGGNFWPREYASEGDLDCREHVTRSGKTEFKCHYVNARANCRR
ncbi:MAG: hypothetical protein ABI895_17500 [Deltaproteobacteria bacterium]